MASLSVPTAVTGSSPSGVLSDEGPSFDRTPTGPAPRENVFARANEQLLALVPEPPQSQAPTNPSFRIPPGSIPPTPPPTEQEITSALAGLSDEEANQVRVVLGAVASSPKGQRDILDLATRRGSDGKSLLLSKDTQGGTMLSHLHALATEPLSPEFNDPASTIYRIDRGELLASLASDLAHPKRLHQGGTQSCSATIMQRVVDERPAELARLVHGLSTPEGKVTLVGGKVLQRPRQSIPADTLEPRRGSASRLLQGALMDYSNGKYDYVGHQDTSWDSKYSHSFVGLNAKMAGKGLEAVTGVAHRQVTGDKAWRQLQTQTRPTMVFMRWDDNPRPNIPDQHVLLVTRIEGGRVYYQNPLPQRDDFPETKRGPTRQVERTGTGEDTGTGEESMTEKEFRARLKTALIPKGPVPLDTAGL